MGDKPLSDVQRRIVSYLTKEVRNGEQYFKSRDIANDLDLSSKSVGTNLGMLQERTDRLSIQQWGGGSSGATWQVEIRDDSVSTPPRIEYSGKKSVARATPMDD